MLDRIESLPVPSMLALSTHSCLKTHTVTFLMTLLIVQNTPGTKRRRLTASTHHFL